MKYTENNIIGIVFRVNDAHSYFEEYIIDKFQRNDRLRVVITWNNGKENTTYYTKKAIELLTSNRWIPLRKINQLYEIN